MSMTDLLPHAHYRTAALIIHIKLCIQCNKHNCIKNIKPNKTGNIVLGGFIVIKGSFAFYSDYMDFPLCKKRMATV